MTAAISLPTSAIGVRLATDADLPFIQDSWHRSAMRQLPTYAEHWGLGRAQWLSQQISHCIRTGLVFVAVVEDYPDVVLGWTCVAPTDVAHYVYVKHDARRMGIAKELLRGCGLQERGVRMTFRPPKALRAVANARGWVYRAMTRKEMGA